MKRIKSKKQKETTRDRHLKWIDYYCSKNFGIWVECTDCKKWRRTLQYSESHEVPENWSCSLLTLENGEKGSCAEPEEDYDEEYIEYCPGSVVWAKLEGYPWWPAMVDEDPDVEEFSWRERGLLHYNVTFLDEKPTRAWIPEMFICPFLKPPKIEKGSLQKLRRSRYAKAISKAKERAEAAMEMTVKDRLQTYSFVHLYKGQWSKAANFEESDSDEDKTMNREDLADILMRELDELGSISSIDSDDERMKDFSDGENNTTEGILISKISDIPSYERKTYNTKFLNNKNFIPENEAVFPLIKKKNSKYSSKQSKILGNAKYPTPIEHAKSVVNPFQEKEAKGIKRKSNRKFTPRKEKNFKKSTDSMTNKIINVEDTDSEHENNEALNTINVPNKDDTSIQVPEKSSMAEDNGNDLPKVPNHEKCESIKQTHNVDPLNKKEFNKKTKTSNVKIVNSSHTSSTEEMLKHIDESISKVVEFLEDSFEKSDECSDSEKIKMFEASKHKKPQNAVENIKQSNDETINLKENNIHLPGVSPESKVQQNEKSSTSKVFKQIKTGATKLTKKPQKSTNPVDGKKNVLPKQTNDFRHLPLAASSSNENDKVVVDKDTTDRNTNMKNKISKPKPENPKKDHNPVVKLKPTFKLPIKVDKPASQVKTKNLDIPIENEKQKADNGKQRNSNECNEDFELSFSDSDEDNNDSAIEKLTENLHVEKIISEPEEKIPEVISIDDDSLPINDAVKPTENDEESFLYFSMSEEEKDDETSKD